MRAARLLFAALLFAALCLPGCGFDAEPPFAGRRIADVAPWQDLGPLTFCEGTARIGPPASGRAGFCGDPARVLKPCVNDGDCRSRERCGCAGCQVALCDSGDECAAFQMCSFSDRRCDRPCDGDSGCAAGETCLPGVGVCRGGCGQDGDCQGGEVCVTGRCEAVVCSGDGDCSDQPACLVQRIAGTLREPSPLVDGPGVVMWVERVTGVGPTRRAAIWRAVSQDGFRFRFDPLRAVIEPQDGDGGRAGAPSVIRHGAGYLAAYANWKGLLRRARSDDGIAFTVDVDPLLAPTAEWEASARCRLRPNGPGVCGLDAPSLAPDPGGPPGALLLYYGTTARAAIGLAESIDGTVFTALPDPVLTPASVADPRLWRDVDAIASPFAEPARSADGTPYLRVYFAARGLESTATLMFGTPVPAVANFSIGEASTLDGRTLVSWPFNPAFDRVHNFLNHTAELDPALIDLRGTRLLYYRGASTDERKPAGLGAAQNPVPVR